MKLPENAKIAVVRLSALGDVCHVMSVVSAIQKRYPHAEITWITGKFEAHLVRMMPNVRVEVFDKKTGLKGMMAIKRRLKGETFDALLHMQWSIRASLLTRMLKAKVRVGFCREQSREKQHWFVNRLATKPAGNHVLDSVMSIAQVIDVPMEKPFWQFNRPVRQTELPDGYVIVNPCASVPIKNWTLFGYREVVDYLLKNKYPVVLTGGPSKTEVEFVTQVAEGLEVINLVGKTSLEELTAIIADAQLIVSPDTGPAHIATMVDTPVITLFAISNPSRTGPYLDQDHIVSVYEKLAPLEYGKPLPEIPWAAKVHDEKAMAQIEVDDVLGKIKEVLAIK